MNDEKYIGNDPIDSGDTESAHAPSSSQDADEPVETDLENSEATAKEEKEQEIEGLVQVPTVEAEGLFDEVRARKVFSKVGFSIALFTVVATGMHSLISLLAATFFPNIYGTYEFTFFLFPFCMYCIALPVLLLVCSTYSSYPTEKKKMGFGEWFMLLLVCFGIMRIGAVIGTMVTLGVEAILGYDTSTGIDSIISSDVDTWIIFVVTVVIAPIGEEFVCRKLMIDKLRKYGCLPSVLLSALVFGLLHGNFSQFFYAFGVGLVFGYVYYRTGRVYYTMVMHAVLNFVGSVVGLWLNDRIMELADIGSQSELQQHIPTLLILLLFLMFVLTTVVAAIAIPIIFRKNV